MARHAGGARRRRFLPHAVLVLLEHLGTALELLQDADGRVSLPHGAASRLCGPHSAALAAVFALTP